YDPADSTAANPLPGQPVPSNLLGFAGAWLAAKLCGTFGAAVYLLLVTWLAGVLLLFVRRNILRNLQTIAGCLLLVPCAAAIADLFKIRIGAVPPTGNGGALGAWITEWLRGDISHWALFAAVLALGASLGANLSLVRIARWSWIGVRAQAGIALTIGRWI